MDTDETLSENLRLLFVRYEHFVRALPAGHPLRTSFYASKASLPSLNEHDVKVPSDPADFLNDFLSRFDEVYRIFDLKGRPDDFRERFDWLQQLIAELSWTGHSISNLAPSWSGEVSDFKIPSRLIGVTNAKEYSTIAYLEEGSVFDVKESDGDHRASCELVRQSNCEVLPSNSYFVDLTTEDPIVRKQCEMISILDSSEEDDNTCDDYPRKKNKVNQHQGSRTTSPSSNNVMDANKAISDSIDLLFARCHNFSRTLPADHSFRTSYRAIEESLPDLRKHFEVQVPTAPTDFLNDIRSRFDEVYGLFDRMGQPHVLSKRLNSLKGLLSDLSDTLDSMSSFAAGKNDKPPGSKGSTPRHVARLKDDSKYEDEQGAGNRGACDSARQSMKGNLSSKDKCVDLTADKPVGKRDHEMTTTPEASEDESVYMSVFANTTETETETEQRTNRVRDSSIASTLQRPLQLVPSQSTRTSRKPMAAHKRKHENNSVLLPQSDEVENDLLESDVPTLLQNLTSSRRGRLPGPSIRLKASGHAQESHGEPIYCVSWSKDFSRSHTEAKEQSVSRYLSTCGKNFATVYRVVFDGSRLRRVKSKHFIMTQSHVADDREESFYACTFAGRSGGHVAYQSGSFNKNMPELLCVGGTRRVIHVIDVLAKKTIMALHGHGDSILNLKPCPTDEWILLSSSEDESIRLWNLRSGAPVAVLKGREGHVDSVICAAWNSNASLIISGGMDTTIKIWDVREGSQLKEAVARSHELVDLFKNEGTIIHEKPLLVKSPVFSTQKVHIHCVDCVQFIHNGLVLSKSVDSRIELWEPVFEGPDSESLRMKNQSNVQHLHTFEYKKGEVWYMSFATDLLFKRLAVGDCVGYVHIWNIGQKSSAPAHVVPTHGNINVPVRGVAFSPCGNTLVAYRDDGSVMKWDL